MDLHKLASNPVGIDQISRARELCGQSESLNATLDALLRTKPTRGQMLDFLEELNKSGKQEAFEEEMSRICEAVGILEPSPQDKLMAMQVGMLREQNEMLQHIARCVGSIPKDKPLSFTGAVGAVILGNMLTR
ncbi:hypothetical protein [Cupriavidus nantongensis]|uniref:Uncharacterized protein n=1 Tax=Cupriavidus nantongensis TaxID=1796606 RepID=A0A142JIT1_9BURK|nr:hypothetical protein [Cupriavidus nantongensis]AMR77993.1 hypothetical protein A2G96_09705 [Cupriavidus nantongensis]